MEVAPPLVSLAESVRTFAGAVETFVGNLAAVSLGLLALGLGLHGLYLLLRTRAWFNALRAAYPTERFRWRNLWAAQMVSYGVNSVIPARAGDPAKLYLAKQSIPCSTYSAVGSSFLIEAPFDLVLALLVVGFAISQGVLPDLPDLSRLPAFDLAFFARNPDLALFTITFVGVAAGVVVAVLSVRVKAFWSLVRQGLVILADRRRYLREVVPWQAGGWIARFASFWVILEAFGIGGSVYAVLLVTAVFSLANLVPFTPQGAGAQQALLGVVLAGAAAGPQIAAYSVGQQLSIAAFNVAMGFLALTVVFRTRDWRSLVRAGREAGTEEAPAAETPTAEAPAAR
ncbi:MAG: flippase-like domain-containing protein [Thermoleophilaceae bacterium]|nr:flippase-like domain-containing protein [Thermoleophilaceae bacterium]